MKNVKGVWLPDDETHFVQHYAKKTNWNYQFFKLAEAVSVCKGNKLAVDVGGHVGLWSKELVHFFKEVVAFEPLPQHIECYRQNLGNLATLHEVALGDKDGNVGIHLVEEVSACSWVKGEGQYPMKRLDDYGLKPDFIKIDCEGYEWFVIKGGEETIREHKPVIIVEQKPGHAEKYGLERTQAVTLLESWGMKLHREIIGDFIMVWP